MRMIVLLAGAALVVLTLTVVVLVLPDTESAPINVVVQGTTDIRDAGLVDDVLVPGFEAAYPQYNLQYVAVGTGQALTNARAGQADAVLTHAPTVEAEFVADGYSYERVGRSVFHSDYVIVGPVADPAGLRTRARNDAVRAFELVAEAGESGHAEFISRGDESGTNVHEKILWANTEGVSLNAAGEPAGPGGDGLAPWYHKVGAGQAATVINADQCNYTGRSGACYDLVDRGTFNRLVDEDTVELALLSDRNDGPSARGGKDLQVSRFSAYAVDPAKVPTANLQGGLAFLDYVTSPAFQERLASYPNAADPAFLADARRPK